MSYYDGNEIIWLKRFNVCISSVDNSSTLSITLSGRLSSSVTISDIWSRYAHPFEKKNFIIPSHFPFSQTVFPACSFAYQLCPCPFLACVMLDLFLKPEISICFRIPSIISIHLFPRKDPFYLQNFDTLKLAYSHQRVSCLPHTDTNIQNITG